MKKLIIPSIIALLLVFAVGGYALVQSMFPMAEPITYPNEADITSLSLMEASNSTSAIALSDFSTVLEYIRNTEPTRKWSIQDYPAAENYYTFEIKTRERHERYFVYAEHEEVYIESHYEGVYEADPQVMSFISSYFEN